MELLVYVDSGGDFRNHRHRRLCTILVPRVATVDPRTGRRRHCRRGQPFRGETVWRNGVLVRADQNHHHHCDDRGRAGRHLLRLW
ncbi:hypothetical protein D3C80_1814110 [compost metagenome]